MYIATDIKKRILSIFKERNLNTQDTLIEIGISKNTLDKANVSMPKADTLAKIADYLNVSVDYLLGRDDKKISPVITTEDGYNELAERITHLSHSELEELDLYLAFLEYRRNLRS